MAFLRFAELTQLSDPGAENLDQWEKEGSVAARESSLLSPSGSKAGKAHRVPVSSQEAFFPSGRVKGAGRDEKAPSTAFHTGQGES